MLSVDLKYLLGIDVGTTSVKVVLIDSNGQFINSTGKEYKLDSGPDDFCEIDADIYWSVVCSLINEIIEQSGIDSSSVAGLAVSSQGETLICLDNKGKPLRKAIVWLDNRSRTEAKIIENKFGRDKLFKVTGQPEILPLWPATRILWLQKHEPEVFKKTHKYLLVQDYIIYKLTGKYYTEQSMVSSSLYFNIVTKEWWDEMLSFIGITTDKLPDLIQSGSNIGTISESASSGTGLTTSTSVVAGSYDHPCGAIGAGNIEPGIVSLTIGASMAMCVTLSETLSDRSMNLPCQCHSLPEKYFLQPYAQTAGLVLKWFKDEFCREETERALLKGLDPYDLIVEKIIDIPPGADGLTMLPHFSGTGSPEFNSNVKGVFAGITFGTTKGHFVRAIMEAVAFNIEQNLEVLRQHDLIIRELRLLGGGAKSKEWSQIVADVTGLRVITMSQNEITSLGAAIIAGTGSGVFRDVPHGCSLCVRVKQIFDPEPGRYNLYRELYKRYISLYGSLEKFWYNNERTQ